MRELAAALADAARLIAGGGVSADARRCCPKLHHGWSLQVARQNLAKPVTNEGCAPPPRRTQKGHRFAASYRVEVVSEGSRSGAMHFLGSDGLSLRCLYLDHPLTRRQWSKSPWQRGTTGAGPWR